MFEYFYHEIFRKTVIGFGTLFNNITIRKTNSQGAVTSILKVPLAYGPTQKFLARLDQNPNINAPTSLSLPRMSFEMNGLTYDSSRKTTSTQTFISQKLSEKTKATKTFMPVPYNMRFELSIMSKNNEDALEIIEQILPYFQPQYNITINLVDEIGEKRDVPVVLEGISMSDDYEGDFTTRRALVYTLNFTAKTYLFGPVDRSGSGLILTSTVDVTTVSPRGPRELRFSASARATQPYDENSSGYCITTIEEDLSADERYITVADASGIAAELTTTVGSRKCVRIVIDGELMHVKQVSGNQLVVERGYEGTVATEHVNGTCINLLSTADDALIEIGDDFGFNETTSFFQDFKEFTQEGDI